MIEKAVQMTHNGRRLYGIAHTPEQNQSSTCAILMVVGGPQTRVGSHRLYVQLARYLASEGLFVFRFDYSGIGDSEGDWSGYKFAGPSIRAAIDHIYDERPNLQQLIIWSLCDGASACAVLNEEERARVSGMVLCNPYLHSKSEMAKTILRHYYIKRLFEKDFWQKIFALRLNVVASFTSFANNVAESRNGAMENELDSDSIVSEILPDELICGLARLDTPVHFLLSTADLTAMQFRDFCTNRKELKKAFKTRQMRIDYVDGADHTFSNKAAKQKLFFKTLTAVEAILRQ